ncbi:MAG: hypothetical protein NTZ40_13520 [Cyanobacteria bacterium]|nr:hypothetical protein [Cyanobacteriota bacterium]
MLERSLTSFSSAFGVVRRLVSNKWEAWKDLPSRVPVAVASRIQLVPIKDSLMCFGASFARSVQLMSSPLRLS